MGTHLPSFPDDLGNPWFEIRTRNLSRAVIQPPVSDKVVGFNVSLNPTVPRNIHWCVFHYGLDPRVGGVVCFESFYHAGGVREDDDMWAGRSGCCYEDGSCLSREDIALVEKSLADTLITD